MRTPLGSATGRPLQTQRAAPPVAHFGGHDMRSAFDFAPFRRSTVGFDRLFDMLENNTIGQSQENYPPFDLRKVGENQFRIELAVAGFKPDEIDITAQQNVLIVSGRKNEESEE